MIEIPDAIVTKIEDNLYEVSFADVLCGYLLESEHKLIDAKPTVSQWNAYGPNEQQRRYNGYTAPSMRQCVIYLVCKYYPFKVTETDK